VKQACVETALGLDLRALPINSSTDAIHLYTRGEADRFRAMVANFTPKIYIVKGVSSFRVELFATTSGPALVACKKAVKRFVPTVPGHPLARTPTGQRVSGGSVITPCRPCSTKR